MAVASQTRGVGLTAAARFTEREKHEAGFKRVFDKEIAPGLSALDAERQSLRRERAVRIVLGLAVAAAILAGAFTLTQDEIVQGIALFVAIAAPFVIVGSPTDKFRGRTRALVMPAVGKFLDIDYNRAVPPEFGITRFLELGVIGSYQPSRSTLQDHVTGTHDGRRYGMVDANLQRKSGKSTITVFKGILLSVEWPEAGSADVLIGRDHGRILNKLAGIGKADRVTFDNAEFEKLYEVYSGDPAAARRLLTPVLLDSLVAIARGRKGQTPTAAFTAGRFLLALPVAGELFETGSLSRSLDRFEEDLHTLLRQLTVPRRIIDILNGSPQQIL